MKRFAGAVVSLLFARPAAARENPGFGTGPLWDPPPAWASTVINGTPGVPAPGAYCPSFNGPGLCPYVRVVDNSVVPCNTGGALIVPLFGNFCAELYSAKGLYNGNTCNGLATPPWARVEQTD